MLINFERASLGTSRVKDVQDFGELLKKMLQYCSDVVDEVSHTSIILNRLILGVISVTFLENSDYVGSSKKVKTLSPFTPEI